MKRGLHIKREIFAWEQEFIAKNIGKVYYPQHNGHLDDSRNRGDLQDLVVDVFHAFFRFFQTVVAAKAFL